MPPYRVAAALFVEVGSRIAVVRARLAVFLVRLLLARLLRGYVVRYRVGEPVKFGTLVAVVVLV